MAPSAPPSAPQSAATLPPPGAGESEESSSAKPRVVISTSDPLVSRMAYSITFFSRSKAPSSERPSERTAVCSSSRSGTPVDLPARAR